MKSDQPTAGEPPEPRATVSLTVGTAGHIDHGKTSLVKLLTGCDCDTLPEEKARGMTIDLGFATCVLPNERRVGIVDVPGHERFIHNMVAGATGIDVVMLVIAADDGVMPQTLEHFHIVRLLGIKSGMVAITKIDMVTPERVQEVMEQARALVAGTFLDGCPIVPVSSKTGDGFDGFYEAFVATVNRTAQRDAGGAFRLHVERSFVLQGLGVIASGIPRSGTVHAGDTLDLLPAGVQAKVRGVQVFGQDAAEGHAGECVALRLGDVSHADVKRGMVLAAPGYFTTTRLVNARLHLMSNLDRPLKPRSAVRFHIGTTDVTGHLVLPDLTPPAPGSEVYVQFQLDDPVVAAPGDFFVARLLSPVRTIGGGNVVSPESVKMRRSRGNWEEGVREREQAYREPAAALTYVLKAHARGPLSLADLARLSFLTADVARENLPALIAQGLVVELPGERYAHADGIAAAQTEILEVLGHMHDQAPLSVGFSKKDWFPKLKSDHLIVDKALAQLLASGNVHQAPAGFQIPGRAPQLTPQQSAAAARIVEIYRKTGLASPRRDELPAVLGLSPQAVDPVFEFLAQTGELVVLSDKVALHKECLEESRRKVVEHITRYGALDSGAAKDILGTTRKYSIPILEYWDAQGLTRRVGNNRVLRERPATAT